MPKSKAGTQCTLHHRLWMDLLAHRCEDRLNTELPDQRQNEHGDDQPKHSVIQTSPASKHKPDEQDAYTADQSDPCRQFEYATGNVASKRSIIERFKQQRRDNQSRCPQHADPKGDSNCLHRVKQPNHQYFHRQTIAAFNSVSAAYAIVVFGSSGGMRARDTAIGSLRKTAQ